MFVKVCGIRTKEQIDWAIELGYDAVGFVCHLQSARFVAENLARELLSHARGKILSVAVGVTSGEVIPFLTDADYLQCSEPLTGARSIYSCDAPPPEIGFDYLLYDHSRGSGRHEAFPSWISDYREKLIIAGGLAPDNAAGVIQDFNPFGVDVSSGVERKRGEKDFELMRQFIQEAKNAAK